MQTNPSILKTCVRQRTQRLIGLAIRTILTRQAMWVVFKIEGFVCKRFLPFFPPPRSFTYAIFPAVFDFPRSLLLNRTETLASQASRIGLCSLTSTGSMEVLPGNRKMHLLRRDVRLNDVNWSLVATSLLGNSGYQTDRKIYDQSKMTLRLATVFRESHG